VLSSRLQVSSFKFKVSSLSEATVSVAFLGLGFYQLNYSTTQLFNFFTLCLSAVSFDFGLWTSDIGLTKTIQLYLIILPKP